MSYTVATMSVPRATFDLVMSKLDAAGYQHAIHWGDGKPHLLDMTHIGIVVAKGSCSGPNCNAIHGVGHSRECIAEYDKATGAISDTDRMDTLEFMMREDEPSQKLHAACKWLDDDRPDDFVMRDMLDKVVLKRRELGL